MTSYQVKCPCGTVLALAVDQTGAPFACPRCGRKLAISRQARITRPAAPAGQAKPAGGARWFLARDKQRLGPYSSAQLKQLAESGAIQPADMLLREGRQKWVNAGSVKGLFRAPEPASREPYAPPVAEPFAELQLMPPEPVYRSTRSAPRMGRPGLWIAAGGIACFALVVTIVVLILRSGADATAAADDNKVAANANQRDTSGPGDALPAKKKLDLSYIAADFNAAFIVHPSRMLKAPFLSKLLEDKQLADLIKQAGIDPRKIEQVIVLIDPLPGGNVAFMPGFIIRFQEPVDGAALLAKALDGPEKVKFEGKEYYRGKGKALAKENDCGFVADERTLVGGGEHTLKKMLAAKDARSPLLDYLPKVDLDHDIIVAFEMDQIEEKQKGPTVRKALDEVLGRSKDSLPPNFEGADKIGEQLKAATVSLDFSGETLLTLKAEARDEKAAATMHDLAKNGIDLLKVVVPSLKKELKNGVPPDLVQPVSTLVDDLMNGVKLTKDGNRVVLSLKMPKELPELIEKLGPMMKDLTAKPTLPPKKKESPPNSEDPPPGGKKTEK